MGQAARNLDESQAKGSGFDAVAHIRRMLANDSHFVVT